MKRDSGGEGQAADPETQPVGADHEAEGARARPLEGHRDAASASLRLEMESSNMYSISFRAAW